MNSEPTPEEIPEREEALGGTEGDLGAPAPTSSPEGDEAVDAGSGDVVSEDATDLENETGDVAVAEPAAESGDAVERRSLIPQAQEETPKDEDTLPTASNISDDEPMEWYVIRVQSGREDTLSSKVAKKIKLAGHDRFVGSVVVPKQKISEVRDGKKRVREMKLYPGYFFMEMQLVEEIWYLLRDTPGVGDFVGGGKKPIPMTASEVQKLQDVLEERERDEPPEIKIEVEKNDTVKINEGPFMNFEGIVEEVQPQKGLIRVMVTIFGRETPVDLEYWQVEKV